jgi:phosphoglycolate phosphatase
LNKAIIFDLDGTLLQTHHHSCRAAHETLRALGLPDVPDALVMHHIGEPADAFLCAIAPDYSDLAAFERLFDANEQAALKQVGTLFDGVPELLRQLTERGYRLAICSNGSREYVETALTVTNVRDWFSRLVCAGEYPDKAAAVAAIRRDWNCEFAIVVGDRVHDMDAAGENGIPFIAAAYGYGGAETGEADYRAQRPLDVLVLTEQIESSFFQ